MSKAKDPVLKQFGLYSRPQKVKYDIFVNHYLSSGNATDAYRKTYKIKKPNGEFKHSVFTIMNHPYVIHRINVRNKELNEKMDNKIIMNRDKILKELEDILEKTKDSSNYNAALKALDQLAKVTGAYAPIQETVTHKGIIINYIKPHQIEESSYDEIDDIDEIEQ